MTLSRRAAPSPVRGAVRPLRPAIRVRWWIFAYMFGFALLSYIQRTSVQVAAGKIMPALHLDQFQIGLLAASFTAAYAFAQLPGGIFGQRYGERLTFVLIGIVGLAATLAFPLASMTLTAGTLFVVLLAGQALLGISQGPVFPMFAVVMESWFPAESWGLVNGLQSAGMNIGGAVTPLLIVMLSRSFGWQGALLWIALPVALLTVAWGWYGRNAPREHPHVTAAELAELGSTANESVRPLTLRRLLKVVGDRNVLLLSLSYLCMNYTFYLLSFWSFLYLEQVRHFSGIEGGLVGALPWIGAGLGAACGGWLSDRLARRLGARWGYRLVPMASLPIAGVLLLVAIRVPTPYAAVLALAVAFFMIEITEGAYWAATMRVARADSGAATGVLNTGGNVAGILTQPLVGYLTNSGIWGGAFITGTAFALAGAALWLIIDPERRAAIE